MAPKTCSSSRRRSRSRATGRRTGEFLLYYVPDPTSGTDLWVLPLDTRVPFVFLRTEANELWGQFSPDGRWVAYQSNETGRYEIYVRPFSCARRADSDLDGRRRLSAMVS